MDMDIYGPTAVHSLASHSDSLVFGDIPSGAVREFCWTDIVAWTRVPSIDDGLLDDYGGYDLRYRSSLHPVLSAFTYGRSLTCLALHPTTE